MFAPSALLMFTVGLLMPMWLPSSVCTEIVPLDCFNASTSPNEVELAVNSTIVVVCNASSPQRPVGGGSVLQCPAMTVRGANSADVIENVSLTVVGNMAPCLSFSLSVRTLVNVTISFRDIAASPSPLHLVTPLILVPQTVMHVSSFRVNFVRSILRTHFVIDNSLGGIFTGTISGWTGLSFSVVNSTIEATVPTGAAALVMFFATCVNEALPASKVRFEVDYSVLHLEVSAVGGDDSAVVCITSGGNDQVGKMLDTAFRVVNSNVSLVYTPMACWANTGDLGFVFLNWITVDRFSVFVAGSTVVVALSALNTMPDTAQQCKLFAFSAAGVIVMFGQVLNGAIDFVNATAVNVVGVAYTSLLLIKPELIHNTSISLIGHINPSLSSQPQNFLLTTGPSAAAVYRVASVLFASVVAARVSAVVYISSNVSNISVHVSGVHAEVFSIGGNASVVVAASANLIQVDAPALRSHVIIESCTLHAVVDNGTIAVQEMAAIMQVALAFLQLGPGAISTSINEGVVVTLTDSVLYGAVGYTTSPGGFLLAALGVSLVAAVSISVSLRNSSCVILRCAVHVRDNYAQLSNVLPVGTNFAFIKAAGLVGLIDPSRSPIAVTFGAAFGAGNFFLPIILESVSFRVEACALSIHQGSTTATQPSPVDVSALVLLPSSIVNSSIVVQNASVVSSVGSVNGVAGISSMWGSDLSSFHSSSSSNRGRLPSIRMSNCVGLSRLMSSVDGSLTIDLGERSMYPSASADEEAFLFLFENISVKFASSAVDAAPLSRIRPQSVAAPIGLYVADGTSSPPAGRKWISIQGGAVTTCEDDGDNIIMSVLCVRGCIFEGNYSGLIAGDDIGMAALGSGCSESTSTKLVTLGCNLWGGRPLPWDRIVVNKSSNALLQWIDRVLYPPSRFNGAVVCPPDPERPTQTLPHGGAAANTSPSFIGKTTPTALFLVASIAVQQLSVGRSANAGAHSLQAMLIVRRLRLLCLAERSGGAASDSEAPVVAGDICCDVSISPTQLSLSLGPRDDASSTEQNVAAPFGAIVGNSILVVSITAAKLLLVCVVQRSIRREGPPVAPPWPSTPRQRPPRRALTENIYSWFSAVLLARISEMLGDSAIIPALWSSYTMLLPPTITVAVGLIATAAIAADPSTIFLINAGVGAVVALVWLGVWLWCYRGIVGLHHCSRKTAAGKRFPFETRLQQRRSLRGVATANARRSIIVRLLAPLLDASEQISIRRRQLPTESVSSIKAHAKELLHQFGAVFGAYKTTRYWYFNVELGFAVANGVVGGYSFAEAESDPCSAVSGWLLLGLGVAEVVAAVIFRPFVVVMDMLALLVISSCCVAAELFALLSEDDSDDVPAGLGVAASVIQMVTLTVATAWGLNQSSANKWASLTSPLVSETCRTSPSPSPQSPERQRHRQQLAQPRLVVGDADKTRGGRVDIQQQLQHLIDIICKERGRRKSCDAPSRPKRLPLHAHP